MLFTTLDVQWRDGKKQERKEIYSIVVYKLVFLVPWNGTGVVEMLLYVFIMWVRLPRRIRRMWCTVSTTRPSKGSPVLEQMSSSLESSSNFFSAENGSSSAFDYHCVELAFEALCAPFQHIDLKGRNHSFHQTRRCIDTLVLNRQTYHLIVLWLAV